MNDRVVRDEGREFQWTDKSLGHHGRLNEETYWPAVFDIMIESETKIPLRGIRVGTLKVGNEEMWEVWRHCSPDTMGGIEVERGKLAVRSIPDGKEVDISSLSFETAMTMFEIMAEEV